MQSTILRRHVIYMPPPTCKVMRGVVNHFIRAQALHKLGILGGAGGRHPQAARLGQLHAAQMVQEGGSEESGCVLLCCCLDTVSKSHEQFSSPLQSSRHCAAQRGLPRTKQCSQQRSLPGPQRCPRRRPPRAPAPAAPAAAAPGPAPTVQRAIETAGVRQAKTSASLSRRAVAEGDNLSAGPLIAPPGLHAPRRAGHLPARR